MLNICTPIWYRPTMSACSPGFSPLRCVLISIASGLSHAGKWYHVTSQTGPDNHIKPAGDWRVNNTHFQWRPPTVGVFCSIRGSYLTSNSTIKRRREGKVQIVVSKNTIKTKAHQHQMISVMQKTWMELRESSHKMEFTLNLTKFGWINQKHHCTINQNCYND